MSNAGKYRCHGARKVMSSIKSMPRYAVVPLNDVRRNMKGYRMRVKDVQSSPREELMEQRVSSIQEVPGRSRWSKL